MPIVLARSGRNHGLRPGWMAAGVLVVALVAIAGFNRNLLYLSILLGIYLVVAMAAHSGVVAATAVLITTLMAVRPFPVPSVDFLSPEGGARERTLREGDELTYRFWLRGGEPFAKVRGRVAELKVDGRNLEGLRVTIDGADHTSRLRRVPKYDYEQARLSFEVSGGEDLVMVLHALPGMEPSILVGPEVDGQDVYPHAVYVEVGNGRGSLVFHARRPIEGIAAP